jgi:hypothetical protein
LLAQIKRINAKGAKEAAAPAFEAAAPAFEAAAETLAVVGAGLPAIF